MQSGGSALGGAAATATVDSGYFGRLAQRLAPLTPPPALRARFEHLVDDDQDLARLYAQAAASISHTAIANENTANSKVGIVFRTATTIARALEIPECG